MRNCADVRLRQSTFAQWYQSAQTLRCENSNVTAASCAFTHHATTGGAGITLSGGRLELVDCGVGGRGGYPPFAAVYVLGGSLRVMGQTLLSTTWSAASVGGWVVWGNGDARIDPSATLAGTGVLVAMNGAVSYPSMPVVAADTGPLGSVAGASLRGPPGAAALFAGAPGLATTVPGFADPLWLAPNTAIAMTAGMLGSPLVAAYLVPVSSSLLGTRIAWQGVTVGGTLQLSNSATYVHR